MICGKGAAERDQAGREQRSDLRIWHHVMTAVHRQEVRERVVLLVPCPYDLIAEAEEERQALVDAPVVLAEERDVVRLTIQRPAVRHLVAHVEGHAQQEVGERVSGRCAAEPILSAEIDAEAKPVASGVARPQAATLQRMRSQDRREAVAEREGVLAHGAVDVAASVGDVAGPVRAGRKLKRREPAAVGRQARCVFDTEP